MRARLAPLLLAGLVSGCAERQVVTWDDVTPTQRWVPPARDAPAPLPRPRGMAAPPADARGSGEPASTHIDRALAHFRARRAANARAPAGSRVHGAAWESVLRAVDEACEIAPVAGDLGAFVRARVTLEVELEQDRRRRRALPRDLDQRIAQSLASIHRRVEELRLLGAPGTFMPAAPLHDEPLVLHAPVSPMRVSSPFGVRRDPLHGRRRFHAGVDVAAPEGTMVFSAAAGIIVYAGWQGAHGRHVVIDHGRGVRTHYSHLSQIFVRTGELVDVNETIGAVGASGRATGPHLHFAVTNAHGRFVDPLEMLGLVVEPEVPVAQLSRH